MATVTELEKGDVTIRLPEIDKPIEIYGVTGVGLVRQAFTAVW